MTTKVTNRMSEETSETLQTRVNSGETEFVVEGLDGKDVLRIEQSGADVPTVSTELTLPIKEDIRVKNLKLLGPETQPSNNEGVLTIARADGAIITGNEVEQGYNSFSLEFADIPPAGEERRSTNSIVANNIMRGNYIGYEMFSPYNSALVGNVARSNRSGKGIQHGLRITGYGEDHLGQGHDLRNRGNAYVGNAYSNWANGISQQTAAYGNVTVSSITDCTNGLQFTENTTLPDAISSSNTHMFAIDGVDRGAILPDAKASHFIGTVKDASVIGWTTSQGTRELRNNTYDINVTESESAARFEDSNSNIKIVLSDIQTNGAVITGNYNIVDIVADDINKSGGSSTALALQGNNNIVRVVGSNIKNNFSDITVTGNNNRVTVSLDTASSAGQVAVTGTGNVIEGNCKVTAASDGDNDFTGVKGWKGVGTFTGTTDATGRVDLGLASVLPDNFTGYDLHASSIEFTNPHNVVRKGSGDALLVVNAQTGAPIVSTSVTLRWNYICYK